MGKLPIIHNIVYPVELLDALETAINENNQISDSYDKNKLQFANLEKALEPMSKISEKGLTFPHIDITNLPNGTIAKQAIFEPRSQKLIFECNKLKHDIMERMRG